MLQAVSTARDTQRQLSALKVQVSELTEQAQQLRLQEEIVGVVPCVSLAKCNIVDEVVTRVRGEAALATKIMQEEAQVT